MFFRRRKARVLSFAERLAGLRQAGFDVRGEAGGKARVERGGCAAVVSQSPERQPLIEHPGLMLGQESGLLVDVGYQKVWQTESGKTVPARAEQLTRLHDFLEDLREGLGLTSLYNESLGTVNEQHLYDRVTDRDRGVPRRAWERS